MKRTMHVLCMLLALLAGSACGQTAPPPGKGATESADVGAARDARPLDVVALANEGFLLRSGEQAVLIDAFLSVPYAGYDALPAEVLARLEGAETPFEGIDLALVSHEHADHVQAEPARRFLAASPDTLLATSPQALAIVVGDDEEGVSNHEAYLPEPGETSVVERNGVRVEFLRLSHGRNFASLQNLGHVITVGGQRVLHLGDAATEARNFRPYALPGRELDVALVPYWYFVERGGRALVEEHLLARHVIACHIPSRERAEIASKLATSHPHVIVPSEPLQSWTIEPPGH